MSTSKIENLSGSKSHNSPNKSIDKLVIIGGGKMGQGIAQAAARRGIDVLLIEKNEEMMNQSLAELEDFMDHEISRWAMTESEKNSILSRITGDVGYDGITDHTYVIETILEDLLRKKEIFAELDKHCVPEAVFITNTSTFSITELASATERPDRFIGMHFINPVPKVRLVELVRGLRTSLQTFNRALQLAEKLERSAIEVFESPGYVTTRVMMPLVNEAIQVLMEGIASAEDIDTAMQMGYELPRGPLAMADSIGLDNVLNWLDTLFHDLGDTKYRPCPLLRMLVRAGHLGQKVGHGFFQYDSEGSIIPGSGQTAAAHKRFIDGRI